MEPSRSWTDSLSRYLVSTPMRYPRWGPRQTREHGFPEPFSQLRCVTYGPESCRCLGTWPYAFCVFQRSALPRSESGLGFYSRIPVLGRAKAQSPSASLSTGFACRLLSPASGGGELGPTLEALSQQGWELFAEEQMSLLPWEGQACVAQTLQLVTNTCPGQYFAKASSHHAQNRNYAFLVPQLPHL